MDSVDWKNVSLNTSLTIPVKNVATQSATNSVPWNKPTLSNKKPALKYMQTLDECITFLEDMAKELEDISQVKKRSRKEKEKGVMDKSDKPISIDQSKSLIQTWAKEVNSLNLSIRVAKTNSVQEVSTHGLQDSDRIMEWARELQSVSESMGVKDEDLKQILSHHSVRHSKLDGLISFLEFVVWSLCSQRSNEDISNIWLSVKQRQWKTEGCQKYIPRSVWQWIQSASADVHLDPSSCHPWLCVSEDRREVRERDNYQLETNKELSCVLGLKSFSSGRHYWEVQVPTCGSWKVGVASASAPRKGSFQVAPDTGYWCIWNGTKNLWACTDPQTKLKQCVRPEVLGVYVDYEEGQVSFYDVSRSFHVYTFTQIFKEALLPVFVCLDGNTVLKVQTAQMSGIAQD